ncbi:hypothetical protein QUF76_04335 [Desulfobacterales bacterium HSG16]|nr:hypothetical protein [Desulfobacterales bacterium HSG16]
MIAKILESKIKNCSIEIIRALISDDSIYNDILFVRGEAYKNSVLYSKIFKSSYTDYDSYSELYCLYINDEPMGTVTGTQATSGKLDCEEYYPTVFLEKYRDIISSASKFATLKYYSCEKINGNRVAHLLLEAVWKDQINMGIRIDIVNVHEKMISYYRKLGYLLITDSFFLHPEFHTPSYVMFLSADESHPSYFQNLFSGLENQMTLDMVSNYIEYQK